jgi:hypothetical protein
VVGQNRGRFEVRHHLVPSEGATFDKTLRGRLIDSDALVQDLLAVEAE